MFEYKTLRNKKPNDTGFVMNNEAEGWELCQIVPETWSNGGEILTYHYWFRRPVYPKGPAPIGRGYSQVVC
jgi:hypothetical protein